MSESLPKELEVTSLLGTKCLFVFLSVHHVMKAEKVLKREGLKIDLIPMPREISSDCGVAVELSLGLKEEALNLLNEHQLSVSACYTKKDGKYEKGQQG